MEIKERIQEFIDFKGFDIKAFEKEIGISNGLWAKTETISEKVLLKVINNWPELNASWILKGEGSMFIESNTTSSNTSDELIRLRDENEKLREKLRMKEDPDQPKKESEVYLLWMEHMKITERMQELYKKEKEG